MIENVNSELRRIRITLVILVIIVAFTSGGRTVSIDHETYDSDFNEDEPVYNSNMIPLEDGYFGVLTSGPIDLEKVVKVYYYDKKQNKLIYKNEAILDSLEQ